MHIRPMLVRLLQTSALPVAAALLVGACAAGVGQPGPAPVVAVAPPPAPTRPPIPRLTPTVPPADLGTVERDAWQTVVELGESFAAGDATAFLSKVSRGFYRGYGTLESSLRALLDDTRSCAAVVAVRKAAQEDGRISVTAEWTRSVTRRDGTVDAWHGETVFFLLNSGNSLRLLDYRGDAPFAIEGI